MKSSLRLEHAGAALTPAWVCRLGHRARTEKLCEGKMWSNSVKSGQLACPAAGQQSRPLDNQRRWTGWGSLAFRPFPPPICVRPRPSAVSILGARFFSGSRDASCFPTSTGPIFVPIVDRFCPALSPPWSVHRPPPISRRKRRRSGSPQDASWDSARRCLGLDVAILFAVLDGNAPRALFKATPLRSHMVPIAFSSISVSLCLRESHRSSANATGPIFVPVVAVDKAAREGASRRL